jgi:hypothetical protein
MARNNRKNPSGDGNSPDDNQFSFGSGRSYADNAEYADKKIAFNILALAFEPGRGFEGRDRWLVTVKAAERDRELLSLGSNPGRDEQLKAAQLHLERGGAIRNVRLLLKGNTYYFTDGDR